MHRDTLLVHIELKMSLSGIYFKQMHDYFRSTRGISYISFMTDIIMAGFL